MADCNIYSITYSIPVSWQLATFALHVLESESVLELLFVSVDPTQWCIAKHGGGYTQKGVAYAYTLYPAYL